MDEGIGRLDDDGDAVVEAVDEPVEGHEEERLTLARPDRFQGLHGKRCEVLVLSLWPCLNVCDHEITAGTTLLKAPKTDRTWIDLLLVRPLKYLAEKVGSAVINRLATVALEWLLKLLS